MCRHTAWILPIMLCIAGSSALLPWRAVAAEAEATRTVSGGCGTPGLRQLSAGIEIQEFDSTDVTGGIAGLPDRLVTQFEPGERGSVCVGFHNRTGGIVRLDISARDIGIDSTGAPRPIEQGEAEFGAAAWLDLPGQRRIRLSHGELAWLTIAVDVPDDTTGGSSYAAITGTVVTDSTNGDGGDTSVQIAPSIAVQVFFDVPGDVERSGELVDIRSPRIVWWDGAGIGDLPILDGLRGRGIAPIRMRWHNTGSFTEQVGGSVVLESDLGGRQVARLPLEERFVLRGASRPFEVTWSRDIPIIGRFTPTVRIDMGSGKTVTRELPAIWVIPAWWYLLALAFAVAIPLWMRRRSKRRYRELLVRLDAAEARGDAERDEDAWSEDDEFDERR